MKKTSFLTLVIIMLISSNFIFSNDSINKIKDYKEDFSDFENKTSNSLIEVIRRNTEKVDKNGDKVADYLEERQGIIDAIIVFEDFSYVPSNFEFGGITLLNSYSSIPALHVSLDSSLLPLIQSLPGIALIEENIEVKPLLAYSTSQLGVRPFLWDQGDVGNGDYSIAIVDSGIDYSHSAFEGRIIASFDAIANTETLVNDNVGHGTHVAGIAAGYPVTGNTYTQTSRGQLPNGGGFFVDMLWANVNASTSITVGMDWGAKGADVPGGSAYVSVVKDNGADSFALACGGCIQHDTTGYIETTFDITTPGDYYIGFGNSTSNVEIPGIDLINYEGWAELTFDSELPSQVKDDGYEEYSGVAPGANIVVIRATDIDEFGDDVGDTNSLNQALGWILTNKEKYNISVVNLSLGAGGPSVSVDSNIALLAGAGVISVVSAGNDGFNSGIYSPASAVEAITVGAVNRYNEIAGYSSNAKDSQSLAKPDVVAPGGSYALPFISFYDHDSSYPEGIGLIIAPDSNNIGVNDRIDDLTGQQGTSMASPHIAGLALLLMEQYAEKNGWNWNSDDVFRIKRAILAGTFEVANIGSAGGETVNFPDQTPTIDRIEKDLVEGWGAVNAQAAFGALDKQMISNQDIIKTFSLEDPFTPNVYAWTTTLEEGKDYSFQATVPIGADIDLLVFDTDTGSDGDLNLIFSSINDTLSFNEQVNLNVGQSKEVMLVVRLVNSVNLADDVTIRFTNPEFSPLVDIIYPSNNSYVNTADLRVDFNSITNSVEAYLDDGFVNNINSGDTVNVVSEGIHNLTLVERNTLLGTSDSDQSIFILDLTLPTINSNLTQLLDQSIEDLELVNYSVTDDLLLDRIEIRVGEIIGSSLQLTSNTSSGVIELDPWKLPVGTQDVEIRVYDKAGNFVSIITSMSLIHKTFVTPQSDFTYESENAEPLVITWNAGSNLSSHYIITIDTEIVQNVTWDGLPIVYTVPNLTIGDHLLEIQVFDENGESASDILIISIVDNLAPRITSPISGKIAVTYDATFEQILVFEIEELNPKSIAFYIDNQLVRDNLWDGNQDQATLKIEGVPGDQNEIKIEALDTEDNLATQTFQIQWIDDTPAVILSPTLKEFTEGSAPNDLIWQWTEKFVTQVVLQLDKETIGSVLDNTVSSISISQDELNKLSSGTYEFRLIVSDTSGHNFAHTIEIKINKESSNDSFLPGFQLALVLSTIILMTITIQKRFRN
ncbi:MAG: Extracellular serine proteinase precursor [Candidatus Heimdallarchaeota archaeon LC_2]|nr:MAG: Extracellular serine proteinase precursor [Candidatus Heimdallarchaeota archaeon LC_2]